MKVLVDVDDVIADFRSVYVGIATRVSKRQLDFTDIYRAWSNGDSLGMTLEEQTRVDSVMRESGVAQTLEPLPGALEGLLAIAERHEVFFVTSPFNSPTWVWDRSMWLIKHFGPDLGGRVVHTKHKHTVAGDVLIDDKSQNIRSWLEHRKTNGGLFAVCWGYPHNAEIQTVPGEVLRTRSWSEVLDALDRRDSPFW